MPIYLDAHALAQVTAEDVALAHQSDLIHQAEFGCTCLTYWFDQSRNSAFCLIEAPEKDAVRKLHYKSHGLIPSEIIEVNSTVVASFLGRIQDPENATLNDDGLKIFSDPSFRVLLMIECVDPILLQYRIGHKNANELLDPFYILLKKHFKDFDGTEAEYGGDALIGSFKSAQQALNCALSLKQEVQEQGWQQMECKISLNAGEPIENSKQLFGNTLQLGHYLCGISKPNCIAIANSLKDLFTHEQYQHYQQLVLCLKAQDEAFLQLLFSLLENYWHNTEFGLMDYCQKAAMSSSQFYRKVKALTGFSFNTMLLQYRLSRAKAQMKKQFASITQISFASGFSSPSYFTKCFKKEYGLQPKEYFHLLT